MNIDIDIKENNLLYIDSKLLEILLIDRTMSTETESVNIIWATDNYSHLGESYSETSEITIQSITGDKGLILRPRVNKTKEEQEYRSKVKAEVFTSAWICNCQNNLIDKEWFGGESPFNTEVNNGWITKTEKISFPTDRTWQDYVLDTRLEMTCGEGPYLVSRYNVVTGEPIPVLDRIGLLDRKLRVVSENCDDPKEWFKWTSESYKSIYGFEWQGDNLLLARESLLYTFIDFYEDKFGKIPTKVQMRKIAEIISWNIWQMDGLKGVIPGSCRDMKITEYSLFETKTTIQKCKGCETNDIYNHNGIYCKIKDWKSRKTIYFIDLLNK